jgi:hypothetical protein
MFSTCFKEVSMKVRGVFFILILLVLSVPPWAAAGPKIMTDDELDHVTAQGVRLKFDFDPEGGGINLDFDAGNLTGTGTVLLNPLSQGAINVAASGTPGFGAVPVNGSLVIQNVENMNFSFNLCYFCKANVLNQLGLQIGATFNSVP